MSMLSHQGLTNPVSGWVVSGVLHSVVLYSLFAFSFHHDTSPPIRFSARSREAITLTMQPSPPEESRLDLDAVKIEVQPERVRMADHGFVVESSAEPDEFSPTISQVTRKRSSLIDTAEESPAAMQPFPRQVTHVALPMNNTSVAAVKTTLPKFYENRPPVYPQAAIVSQLEGTVLLRLYISDVGLVTKVEILESSQHLVLDGAAINSVKHWKCDPATRRGKNVSTTVRLPIKFKLPSP